MATYCDPSPKFVVSADITYLDGSLKGLTIPAGYKVSYPCERLAVKLAGWIDKVRRENDFVRAVGSGWRYVFASKPQVLRILPIGEPI